MSICDCELSHNGLGLAGRECDCPAGRAPMTDLNDLAARVEAGTGADRVKLAREALEDVGKALEAVNRRLLIAEDIIATVAVNCRKASDPAATVHAFAWVDYRKWLDTGVYPGDPASALKALGADNDHG